MNKKQFIVTILLSALIGAIVGAGVLTFLLVKKPSAHDLIKDFYATENAVHVSPHGLRGKMDTGDDSFILVDLRSAEEYEKEHIIGAINIPAYKDKYTSAYGDVERIVGAFNELSPEKDIIVYCYSTACMTGRKIGDMLAKHDIFVKHLGIGWNEWRFNWNSWNHQHEWNTTTVYDYIQKGKEAGIPKVKKEVSSTCSVGSFGC